MSVLHDLESVVEGRMAVEIISGVECQSGVSVKSDFNEFEQKLYITYKVLINLIKPFIDKTRIQQVSCVPRYLKYNTKWSYSFYVQDLESLQGTCIHCTTLPDI
ncbi:hypothetical protein ACF0H5_007158 [Mactra antiquata]